MNQDIRDSFDDEYFEKMKEENELQRLFMQAEIGAIFCGNGEVPPHVENLFLRQVRELEREFEHCREISIYELLGKPHFKTVNELSPAELKKELKGFMNLLREKNVELVIQGDYDDREIYRFITEEFFQQVTDDVQMPGLIRCYSYEEFHPDHENEIRKNAGTFFSGWFSLKPDHFPQIFCDSIVFDDQTISRNQLLDRISKIFSCYTSLENQRFVITEVKFEFREKEIGLGHCAGFVSYDARTETGELVRFEGDFMIYMFNQFGFWEIFSLVLPGFTWNG